MTFSWFDNAAELVQLKLKELTQGRPWHPELYGNGFSDKERAK